MEEEIKIKERKPTWRIKVVFAIAIFLMKILIESDEINYRWSHQAKETLHELREKITEIMDEN